MIVVISALIGVGFGVHSAKRREGNRLDLAQYAAGYGIAFALIGLFLGILFERLVA